MREQVIAALGDVRYDEFLVYIMGPYKAFDLTDLVDDPDEIPASFRDWNHDAGEYTHDEVVGLLRRVQGSLRTDPGVNAFLAVDVDVPLDEVDAATQSIEFARASNAVVFVVPLVGKNLGVGSGVGSVLDDLDEGDRQRVTFVHESGVRSAMIQSVSRRWDAAVRSYEDERELEAAIRQFVVDVMHREVVGELPRKG